ncbi:MAG: DNA polymerase III subunit beta, partial [Oscillospiraceae bacterium]|nr:DNA polymerase III subunit beta [Oscillospiraceae bacterium]
MKFSCEKSYLLTAANTASRAASPKSDITALEGLLIEADTDITISGYDLKTGIRTKLPADVTEPGKLVLDARLFGDIIRKLPDDVVTVESKDGVMTKISCAMSEFNILGTPAVNYPELPTVDHQHSLRIKEGLLKAMISQTNFAVSTNEARPIHTGELFEADGET